MALDDLIKNFVWGASPFSDRLMIVQLAHPSNYYTDRTCLPIAGVFHEPQEAADRVESTPTYFQNPNVDASTRYYQDNDGDCYQCVPLNRPAIANGLKGRPMPVFNDGGPEFGAYSLNQQTENVEVEGFTHNIKDTFTEQQWQGCVDLGVLWMVMWSWPRNPNRFLSHKQLASDRSDGEWIATQSGIPQEVVKRVTKLEQDIKEIKALVWSQALKWNDQDKNNREQGALIVSHATRLNALEAK